MAQLSANENELIRAYIAKLMTPEQEAAFLAIVRQKPDLKTELENRERAYYKALFAEIRQELPSPAKSTPTWYQQWIIKPLIKFWYVDLYHMKTYLNRLLKSHSAEDR